MGAGRGHCLLQRVCHQQAGHTGTCNYLRGLWRCSFARDAEESSKPQAAQDGQFQSCSCEEASPFSFPPPRDADMGTKALSHPLQGAWVRTEPG